VSDIDTEVVDSLKVLDPNRPIREATSLFGADEVTLRANMRPAAKAYVVDLESRLLMAKT